MKANDNTVLLSANVKFEPMITFIQYIVYPSFSTTVYPSN